MKKVLFGVLLLVISVFTHAQQLPTPEVDIYIAPAPKDIPMKLEYPGRLTASGEIILVSRVTGILMEKNFKEGGFAKKGDTLYKIEPDIYKAETDTLKSQLKVAEAQLKKAENDYKRAKASYDDKVLSQQDFDNAASALEIQKANLELAKARLAQAEINLNYTNITAPESGFLGTELLSVGNLVTPGSKLVKITKTDPIYVEFSIPDKDFKEIKDYFNTTVKTFITLTLSNGKQKNGFVNFADVVIDEKTSSVKIRGEINNKEGELMPGDFVRVSLNNIMQKGVIKIPQKAVIQNPMGAIVFVSDNLSVGVRPVVIDGTEEGYFIIKNGLKQGDRVIVNNFFKIKPGMKIKEGNIEKGGN